MADRESGVWSALKKRAMGYASGSNLINLDELRSTTPPGTPIEKQIVLDALSKLFNANSEEYREDCKLLLRFFFDQQYQDTLDHFVEVFPQTYDDMQPIILNIVKMIVNSRAQSYLFDTLRAPYRIVNGREELLDPEDPICQKWRELQREVDWHNTFSQAEYYLHLFWTVSLYFRVDPEFKTIYIQPLSPHEYDVSPHPIFPQKIQYSHAVMLESLLPENIEGDPQELIYMSFLRSRYGVEWGYLDDSRDHLSVSPYTGEGYDTRLDYVDDKGRFVLPFSACHKHKYNGAFFLPLPEYKHWQLNISSEISSTMRDAKYNGSGVPFFKGFQRKEVPKVWDPSAPIQSTNPDASVELVTAPAVFESRFKIIERLLSIFCYIEQVPHSFVKDIMERTGAAIVEMRKPAELEKVRDVKRQTEFEQTSFEILKAVIKKEASRGNMDPAYVIPDDIHIFPVYHYPQAPISQAEAQAEEIQIRSGTKDAADVVAGRTYVPKHIAQQLLEKYGDYANFGQAQQPEPELDLSSDPSSDPIDAPPDTAPPTIE